jgi:transcriptional regulator with XRE-family HTH domain
MTALHTDEYKRFAALLVKARHDAGLSQYDMAARLGVPQSFISKYEGSRRRLDVIEFARIAYAMNADPAQLLKDLGRNVGTFPNGGTGD